MMTPVTVSYTHLDVYKRQVLVLNKSDLDFDRQSVEEQINHISNQIPVFFTSIHQPQTILRLRESISEGETVVFVGSSGVGKSSLVNALCEKSCLLYTSIPKENVQFAA